MIKWLHAAYVWLTQADATEPTWVDVLDYGTGEILAAVGEERLRQVRMWGVQRHVDLAPRTRLDAQVTLSQTRQYNDKSATEGTLTWDGILLEEVYEAFTADTPEDMARELVEVAAVAVAWVEDLRSRKVIQ